MKNIDIKSLLVVGLFLFVIVGCTQSETQKNQTGRFVHLDEHLGSEGDCLMLDTENGDVYLVRFTGSMHGIVFMADVTEKLKKGEVPYEWKKVATIR